MARYYQVISADGHVETPPDSWGKYVPEKYKDRAPRLIKLQEGGEGWIVEGQPLLHNGQNITGDKTLAPNAGGSRVKFRYDSYYTADGGFAPGAGPAAQRLREQDQDGIDCEVLYPPVFATRFIEGIQDRDAYLAMVQSYNTFLAQDYCAVAPDRLIGNGIMPINGVDASIAEMKRCKEMGVKAISFHQFPNGGGQIKPEDDKFWEAALDLGMCLSPHLGFGDQQPQRLTSSAGTGNTEFAAAMMQRVNGTGMYPIVQMIAAGVFDRFPQLQIYIAETNASWMPSAFFFLDDSYRLFHEWFGVNLKMLPSEYIKNHFWFSFIRDPMALRLRDALPVERLMWGSDFPHSVGSFPNSQGWLDIIFEGVDEGLKRKILVENPCNFFGLDPNKPITETPQVEALAAR